MSEGRRILVVEDDDSFRSVLAGEIRKSDLEVIEARNANEAIAAINSVTFELIVLDLKLAQSSGFAVIEHLRKSSRRPFVIVMSNFPRPATHDLDPEVVQLVVQKPFEAPELSAIVEAVVKFFPPQT
jgi:DNA-binding response OmpR family regulator